MGQVVVEMVEIWIRMGGQHRLLLPSQIQQTF